MTSSKQKNLKWKKWRARLLQSFKKNNGLHKARFSFSTDSGVRLFGRKIRCKNNNWLKMHGLPKKRKVR